MLIRLRTLIVIVAVGLSSLAHVGTTNASFDGLAGPYGIRVIVRTPGVIPGLAQISIRLTDGSEPKQVSVRPLRSDVGLQGAPPPDVAQPVAGQPGLYAAELWLMTPGSYGVQVQVEGDRGQGRALVPVLAVAERRLAMHPLMGAALAGAALFLLVGGITVFGAAVRESVLEPGDVPDRVRVRRGRIAMAVGTLGLAAVGAGGWAWWDVVDAAYQQRIFRPFDTSAALAPGGRTGILSLTVDDPDWRGRAWTPLMPDHGKLMHMFLVRDDLAAFAHVHPTPTTPDRFDVVFPPLPDGRYRIYADIVHESGFTQTLTNAINWRGGTTASAPSSTLRPDPDDSWAAVGGPGGEPADVFRLPSGRRMGWDPGGAVIANQETTLRVQVTEADGRPSVLESYMGMLSHAAVTRQDGSVFVHLHPSGSINLAAQTALERRSQPGQNAPTGGVGPDGHHTRPRPTTGSVSFPFIFPTPGVYRIFVQVKVDARVETGAFDLQVDGRS